MIYQRLTELPVVSIVYVFFELEGIVGLKNGLRMVVGIREHNIRGENEECS